MRFAVINWATRHHDARADFVLSRIVNVKQRSHRYVALLKTGFYRCHTSARDCHFRFLSRAPLHCSDVVDEAPYPRSAAGDARGLPATTVAYNTGATQLPTTTTYLELRLQLPTLVQWPVRPKTTGPTIDPRLTGVDEHHTQLLQDTGSCWDKTYSTRHWLLEQRRPTAVSDMLIKLA